MAFINGEIRILYFKVNSVYIPVGCLTDNSFSESAVMLPTTTRDNTDGWGSSLPTSQSYSISFSGLVTTDFIDSSKVGYYRLRELKRSRTLVEWKVDDGLDGFDYGSAYITSLSDSSGIDDFISFSGDLQGYGEPLNQVTVLFDSYYARVIADGGTVEAEDCLKIYINSII
tara:strand:- start:1941 stop:2453 length:513 start_codon:yes stop_codon:yes gene_type:complete